MKTPQTQKEFIDYRFNETIKSIESVENAVRAVNDKLDTNFATKDYVDSRTKEIERRLDDIESNNQWVVRLIVGAVILALLGLIIKNKVSS